MKFLHAADLHLGKRLGEFSLLEDQKYALDEVLKIAEREKADAVLLAGDIYQKASPQAEAMQLFNDFVTRLSEKGIPVFAISGNHDSERRIAYFSDLIRKSGVYVSEVFSGTVQKVTLEDASGPVHIYLLPFIRPSAVRRFYPEERIETYEDAVRTVISHAGINTDERNILLCHQLVTGAEMCESEEIAVGGLDNISPSVFDAFDYVALGHIHKPQRAGREGMRYAGSLLKYSISEKDHKKGVTIVSLPCKGKLEIRHENILPMHDVREVRGMLSELMLLPYTEDYVRCVVTDELPPPDARVTLLTVFPNMLKFAVENSKTKLDLDVSQKEDILNKSVEELFSDFYRLQNNDRLPDEKQLQLIREILRDMEEEKHEAR